MAHDVTEKRQADSALLESEERYRELFENANDIIYTIDLAGNFTSLNRTGEILTGYSRAEALQMNIGQVVAPDHLEMVKSNLTRKIEANDESTVYEADIITKSGKPLAGGPQQQINNPRGKASRRPGRGSRYHRAEAG